MKGLASQRMRRLNSEIIDDLRNFLFGQPGSGGMDLAALISKEEEITSLLLIIK